MTQKEFVELSETEVRSLNGFGSLDYVTEAFRGGYIHTMKEVSEILNNSDDFIQQLEDFVNQDLDFMDDNNN